MKKIMNTFAKVGFPGALGSMDVTHFRWLRCPKDSANFCKGKYPFPTLACQSIVDHNRKILFVSSLFNGRENDKTITVNQNLTYHIMTGKFRDVEFNLYDEEGFLRKCKGGYIIVDDGYQNVPCFVDPLHNANGHKEVHWSEFLESVRKDVECTFGILKSCFRILRNGLQCRDRDTCSNIVKTCAILHNMLLSYDGLDEFTWDDNDTTESDPDMTDSDIYFHQPNRMGETVLEENEQVPCGTSLTGFHFDPSIRSHYDTIRKCLINHLQHQLRYGQLQWPLRFSSACKQEHPMVRVEQALEEHTYHSLYVHEGTGLFCRVLLPSTTRGIKLTHFTGVETDCKANCARNCYEECGVRELPIANYKRIHDDLWTLPNTEILSNCELVYSHPNILDLVP